MLEDRAGNMWVGVDDGLYFFQKGGFRGVRGPRGEPLGLVVGLALMGLLVGTTLDFAAPAFAELSAGGYGVAPAGSSRARFLVYLRVVATGVYLVYALGVASDATAGITSAFGFATV